MDFLKQVETMLLLNTCKPDREQTVQEEVDMTVPRHVLCFGDSLTAGFCDGGRQFTPYGKILEKAFGQAGLDCQVSIMGLTGHEAKQMVREFNLPTTKKDLTGFSGHGLGWMLDHGERPDLVIIMAGTNDLASPEANPKTIFADVRRLHAACHARGIRTIAVAPPTPAKQQTVLSQLIRKWAQTQEQVLAFVDPEIVLPRSTAAFWEPDVIHLSPAGSRALGKRLSIDILKELARSGSEEAKKSLLNVRRASARGGA